MRVMIGRADANPTEARPNAIADLRGHVGC